MPPLEEASLGLGPLLVMEPVHAPRSITARPTAADANRETEGLITAASLHRSSLTDSLIMVSKSAVPGRQRQMWLTLTSPPMSL
jgi:hypothetical protein